MSKFFGKDQPISLGMQKLKAKKEEQLRKIVEKQRELARIRKNLAQRRY